MTFSITSTIKLNNGVEMPRFGIGTFKSEKGITTQNAVSWALEAGYRHIDTAAYYGNEEDVAIAISRCNIPRHEVFIVTKLWNDDQGYESTIRAFENSLKQLRTDYIDLYLVHWPVTRLRGETWKAFVKLYEQGKCRSIGVSNYTKRHLDELLAESPIVPAVNQVEFSPFLFRAELSEYCIKKDIRLTAWAPLSRGRKLDDPRLLELAQKYHKTAAQLVIRWVLQHDMIVIPKSVHQDRILENAQVFDFDITAEDMRTIDEFNENFWVVNPAMNPETSPNWE